MVGVVDKKETSLEGAIRECRKNQKLIQIKYNRVITIVIKKGTRFCRCMDSNRQYKNRRTNIARERDSKNWF